MRRERALLFIALLILARFIAAALLPLSADEAYYWLWSQHLSAGYYDHPPAIAYLIRAGTFVFGDSAFGVRFGGLILSVAASWFVFKSAVLILKDESAALSATLFFNAMLMIVVETMAATPDAPSIATSSAFLFCLAKLQDSKDARWWLAAGSAAGLGLLSKYSGLFIGVGALFWLVAAPAQRRWLTSPFPYLGGVIAAAIFAPNIWWNQTHGWATFAFQFGRISGSGFTLRYLLEFIGAEILLATPFIFLLGIAGLARARRGDVFLAAALCWPSLVYFLWHTLHDRVQGNWPCFLFPAFAILAAMDWNWTGWRKQLLDFSRKAAMPVALALLALCYVQAFFNVIPLGRNDPLARLLAVGMNDVTRDIANAQRDAGAAGLLTTDYASAGWLRFYMPGQSVVAATEDFRWSMAKPADPQLLQKPLLYVTEDRRDQYEKLAAFFSDIRLVAEIDRSAHGAAVAHYRVYRLGGWHGQAIGRLP